MDKKKTFFQQPSVSQIKNQRPIKIISENFIHEICVLENNGAIIIKRDLIPKQFSSARKFMKHGLELKLPRSKSLEALLQIKKTPIQFREESFNEIKNKACYSYSFKPFIGNDRRTRKISLVECLEGTKIYCYVNREIPDNQFKPFINIKPYDDAEGVKKDGGEILVHIPSRRKGQLRYEILFSSVPIFDNDRKFGLSYNISTNHSCKSKQFNIRYKKIKDKETSKQFNFCAHEIAGYLSIIDYYWNKKKNLIPLEMNQFAIPTQKCVNFYIKLCNNCLIETSKEKIIRKLNQAEKEILLWGLVYKLGYDKTFFARDKLKNYDWNF